MGWWMRGGSPPGLGGGGVVGEAGNAAQARRHPPPPMPPPLLFSPVGLGGTRRPRGSRWRRRRPVPPATAGCAGRQRRGQGRWYCTSSLKQGSTKRGGNATMRVGVTASSLSTAGSVGYPPRLPRLAPRKDHVAPWTTERHSVPLSQRRRGWWPPPSHDNGDLTAAAGGTLVTGGQRVRGSGLAALLPLRAASVAVPVLPSPARHDRRRPGRGC